VYFEQYELLVGELSVDFPVLDVVNIIGEANQKEFITKFGSILRLLNILSSFDEFTGNQILSDRDFQDYRSAYLRLYADLRQQAKGDIEIINDDLVFEIELVKQVEVNVDYILILVQKYLDAGKGQDKEIRAEIARAIDSSPSLRNKKDLIEDFVNSLTLGGSVDDNWRRFVEHRKNEELEIIIHEEGLNAAATHAVVEQAIREGAVPEAGTAIANVLPAMSRFGSDDAHGVKKRQVLERLQRYVERFFGLASE
jgi:type I restriction enzyme R subunit